MSEVAICNRALIKLGADTITSLADDNKRGRTMNVSYGPVRDAELRRHVWRFSLRRASLPALAVVPAFDFAHAFQLPVDYLRLVEGGDIQNVADLSDYRSFSHENYSVEGGTVLTNLPAPLKIRYVAAIVDTALFDSAFIEALAARLAWETCETLTQSDSKRQLAASEYKSAIGEAVRANALESASKSIADDSWVLARAR